MRTDAETLSAVAEGIQPSTIRFFRFKEPTVSFGRLQKPKIIAAQVPEGWAMIQRPTGGGIVFHQDDLCISLCWRAGEGPLPPRPQDQYRWIHSIVLDALREESGVPLRMAECGDVKAADEPFAVRTCFQNPVGYDILKDQKKIVGGALRCTRRATLYQGSIQIPITAGFEPRLRTAFHVAP